MNKDTFWFKHDSNASQDPKMVMLTSVYGFEGYGRFWRIIEMIREQEGYRIDISSKHAFKMFASLLMFPSEEEAKNFIQDCVEEFNLLEMDEEYIWSPSLARRMETWDNKKAQAKKAIKARWEKKKTAKKETAVDTEEAGKSPPEKQETYGRNTDVIRTYNGRNTIREEKRREEEIRQDKSREDKTRVEKERESDFGENEISASLDESLDDQSRGIIEIRPPSTKDFVLERLQLSNAQISKHMKIVLSRLPEANIQAEFYRQCKNQGIRCILEYKVEDCKFDALIYDKSRNVRLIVEIKSYSIHKQKTGNYNTDTKQLKKYQKHGLPILLIGGMLDIDFAIKHILDNHQDCIITKTLKKEKSLHAKAKARFTHWHATKFPNSPDFYWSPKEIGQLTRFLKMLQHSASSKGTSWQTDDEFIEKVFDIFCQRYFDSKAWFSDTFTPSAIVSNFNRIIQTLSSSQNGQGNSKVTDTYKAEILERLSRVGTVG